MGTCDWERVPVQIEMVMDSLNSSVAYASFGPKTLDVLRNGHGTYMQPITRIESDMVQYIYLAR